MPKNTSEKSKAPKSDTAEKKLLLDIANRLQKDADIRAAEQADKAKQDAANKKSQKATKEGTDAEKAQNEAEKKEANEDKKKEKSEAKLGWFAQLGMELYDNKNLLKKKPVEKPDPKNEETLNTSDLPTTNPDTVKMSPAPDTQAAKGFEATPEPGASDDEPQESPQSRPAFNPDDSQDDDDDDDDDDNDNGLNLS